MKVFIITIVFFSLFLIGCQKQQAIYDPNNYEAINNAVINYQTVYDIINFSDLTASSVSINANSCLQINVDSSGNRKIYHLNFGNEPCLYPDNRSRTGSITINATTIYPQTDSITTITLLNYTANGYNLNGIITLKHLNTGSNKYMSIICDDLKITALDNNYSSAINLFMSKNNSGYSYIKGSIKAAGDRINFSTSTIDSLGVYNLYFNNYNPYYNNFSAYYVKGKAMVSTASFSTELNYGNFEVDDLATATNNDFRFIIELAKY